MTSAASSARRAAGTLRPRPPGGSGLRSGGHGRGRRGGVGGVSAEQRVAPQQADQREVAVQAGPGAPLVVAQAELLLAVLMEALHRPPLVAEPQLPGKWQAVEPPREVPLRVAVLTRKRSLAETASPFRRINWNSTACAPAADIDPPSFLLLFFLRE